MKAQTCWEHVKTAAREARKPRSIQQKSVHRKRDNEVSQHSAEVGRKGGAWPHKKSTRRIQMYAWRRPRSSAREKERDGTQEVLPRTTTTLVVLKASVDHAVAESRRSVQNSEQVCAFTRAAIQAKVACSPQSH